MLSVFRFTVAVLLFGTALHANGLRVDIDNLSPGRTDMYTDRWNNWAPESDVTVSTTIGNITVLFRNAGNSGTGIRCAWYKGLLTHGATRTVDGLIIEDGTSGCAMEMVLSGLSAGQHSIVTWHSFFDNVTGSTMELSVDGTVRHRGVTVPTRVTDDFDATRLYTEFEVTEGHDVVIRFRAEGNGAFDNVVLNAFEIDGTDPEKMISDVSPTEGDFHYPMENGLRWTAAPGAASHDVYFGEDSAAVDNATTASGEFRGNQTSTDYSLTGLTSLATYWWRVDERINGSTVKGDVLPFRIRRLAFPTAEGYGRFARGGRGGRVVEVTTLSDAGSGSLRNALVEEKGPRTVVFRVGGVIALSSKLIIPSDGGDVYIAGQTAPGDGICVTRFAMGPLGATDVIIRHIRLRVGDYAQDAMDGMGMASCDHSIIDHCSISWSVDEAYSSRGAKNITYQRNLIAEALNNSVHFNGTHSFAASISGRYGSFLRNLHAHCTGRNWSLAGGLEQDAETYGGYCEIINNVVYNWRDRTTDGGVRQLNFVGNFYKAGPVSTLMQLASIDGDELNTGDMQRAYISGNKMINASGGTVVSPTSDNWSKCISKFNTVAEVRSTTPLFPISVSPLIADEAYADVLADVGATKPKLDAIDTRIIREVREGSFTYTGSRDGLRGILDSQNDAGGYPTMSGGTAPQDSDHDGMPDDWESDHGLDPDNAEDRNGTDHSTSGYTNLEMYLNELAGDPVEWVTTAAQTVPPTFGKKRITVTANGLTLTAATTTSLRVELLDLSGKVCAVLYDGVVKTGRVTVPLNGNITHSAGVRLVRVSESGRVRVIPVMMVR